MESLNTIKLKDYLTISIPTHILPSAPSTDIIEGTINSIRDNFIGVSDCRFIIYCDSRTSVNPSKIEYIENLNKINNVTVVDRPNSGLQSNYIKGIVDSTTPFVFCCEHDWIFLREIDTPKLIKSMLEYDSINYVRFNKRDNKYPHKDNPEPADVVFWETYVEEESNVGEQLLMKTDAIATHPHIIRTSKFMNDWFDIASAQGGLTGQVEQNLYNRYTENIRDLGFAKAHKNWGIYNYGGKDETKIIVHSDGSEEGRT
jgi:hypothetical protein